MTDKELLGRITIDPGVVVGKPVIRDTRLSVEFIVGLLAHATTIEEIVAEYPGLTADDVHACLLFASKALESTTFGPLPSAVA